MADGGAAASPSPGPVADPATEEDGWPGDAVTPVGADGPDESDAAAAFDAEALATSGGGADVSVVISGIACTSGRADSAIQAATHSAVATRRATTAAWCPLRRVLHAARTGTGMRSPSPAETL